MEPIKHPDANRVLGPPRDWNEAENGPCETLHVFATVQGDNVVIQSAWMPSAEELAALNAGQPLILMVYGTVIPPMAVGVLAPPEQMCVNCGKPIPREGVEGCALEHCACARILNFGGVDKIPGSSPFEAGGQMSEAMRDGEIAFRGQDHIPEELARFNAEDAKGDQS